MSQDSSKPPLEWIRESKKEEPNDNVNPLYYRDDMSFLRDNATSNSASETLMTFLQENPFVGFGTLATTGFLIGGLKSFYQENKKKSQFMMRGRVIAQGLTVAALLGGALLEASKRTSSTPPPSSQ